MIPVKITPIGDKDTARMYVGDALRNMQVLENLMSYQGIKIDRRVVKPYPWLTITAEKINNHREVFIDVTGVSSITTVTDKKKEYDIESHLIHCVWKRWDNELEMFYPFGRDIALKNDLTGIASFSNLTAKISDYIVSAVSQVRYTHEGKVASLINYVESTGTDSSIVTQVIGERGIPNLREAINLEYHTSPKSAFSNDLSRLYLSYTTTEAPPEISYTVCEVVDGEWSGSNKSIDYTGYSFWSGAVTRDGMIGSFSTGTPYSSEDSSTTCYEAVRYDETSTIYQPYSLDASTDLIVSMNYLFAGSVIAPLNGVWDYRNYESSGSLKYYSHYALAQYNSSYNDDFNHFHMSWTGEYENIVGDAFNWSCGIIVEPSGHYERYESVRQTFDYSHDCCWSYSRTCGESAVFYDGGQFGFNLNPSTYISGIREGTMLVSPISRSVDDGGSGYLAFNACEVILSGMCPAITPLWQTYVTAVNTQDLFHPVKTPITDVSGVLEGFISHDQNTELTFYAVRYREAGESDYILKIYLRTPDDTEVDITEEIFAEIKRYIEIDLEKGVLEQMTEDEKTTYCINAFQYIYFEEKTFEVV